MDGVRCFNKAYMNALLTWVSACKSKRVHTGDGSARAGVEASGRAGVAVVVGSSSR